MAFQKLITTPTLYGTILNRGMVMTRCVYIASEIYKYLKYHWNNAKQRPENDGYVSLDYYPSHDMIWYASSHHQL